MKTANVAVSVTNMKFTYFAYQHEKESIPANVPVSMEVTHFCCREGSRDPSTIPRSWFTSTKNSKDPDHSRSPQQTPLLCRLALALLLALGVVSLALPFVWIGLMLPFCRLTLPFSFGCSSLLPLLLAFAALHCNVLSNGALGRPDNGIG